MTTIIKPSYAKVNLFLDILGLREDGYHDLCMVNAKISLHDEVSCKLNLSGDIQLTSNLTDIPLDEKNTASKAAQLFLETAHVKHGMEIHLEKRIPHGAGLGGGSSNAAVVLQALQELTDNPLSQQHLREIAVRIGADVPFFLFQNACHIEGIGETIVELEYDASGINMPYVVLVSPAVGVSTGKAYGLWDESSQKIHTGVGAMIESIQQKRFHQLHQHLFNSFEPVIYSAYPQINQVYLDFRDVCPTKPLLSGSGSNIFALLNEESEAEHVMAIMNKRGYQAQVHKLIL